MANIRTFDVDDILVFLRINWLYTLAFLLKSPHTVALVPAFQALGPTLDAAIKKQTDLEDAVTTAAAARDITDADLDQLVMQIVHALLMVAKNNREDPLVVSYLGSQTPSEIIKPVLGAELITVAAWVEPLKKETDTTLQAFGATLETQVAIGRAAEKEVKAAEKALSDFRLTGQRKKATDALNSARGSLLGSLLKFQHDNHQLRLPRNWAISFFRHEARAVKYGTTVAEAEDHLARLLAEVETAKAHLSTLQKKAAAYEEARTKRAEARAALAAAHKVDKEQKKQEKALEAVAKKKLKKK